MPHALASFEGGQRGHGWMNWVLTSNGLRRLAFCRSADLLAGPVTLQRAFSSVTLAASKRLPRDSEDYPRLLAIDEHKARLSREVGGNLRISAVVFCMRQVMCFCQLCATVFFTENKTVGRQAPKPSTVTQLTVASKKTLFLASPKKRL